MSARLFGLLIDLWAAFFVAHSTVQYLPSQAAKFVGNYRSGVLVSETWHIAAIENLEDASLRAGLMKPAMPRGKADR